MSHIHSVLCELRKHFVTVKLSRCVGGATSLEFLGRVVGCHGISIPQTRVQAFQSYVKPQTTKQMRSFLGLIVIL